MRFVLLAVLFILAPSLEAALDPAKSPNNYVRRNWDIDSGLPQNTVTAMVQTPDGYMWFGTENGLARFDGRHFTVFDKQHTSGLLSNQISSLAVDGENALWVGTRGGGISRFRKGEFEAFLTQSGVPGNSVRCLHADAKGSVWIGTENSGLVRFSSGVFQTYTMASGLLDNSVVAMASDPNGSFWVATSTGLNVMERGRFLPLLRNSPATPNFIRSMYADLHRNLWLGTNGYGVMAWQPGKAGYSTTYTARQGLTDDTVTAIFQDSADTLWVGTLNGGLNRIISGKVTALPAAGSSRGVAVLNIMEDREGGLWIGTNARGATCLRNNAITTLAQSSGLPSDIILPIFEDAQQTMWIGTNQGLVHFRTGGSDHYAVHEGLPDELVSSITQDGSGAIWAGTRRGLARLLPKARKFVPVPNQPGLESSFIHCLFADRNGDIWIGSRSGLTHYDGKRFVTYTADDGLPSSHVLSIHQSRDGALWAGTDGGLVVLREGRFTSYGAHDGLPDDVILAITEDSEGEILLGTGGAGIVRFASGRFNAFGTAQGLPDDTIYQILDDRAGRLWMSSTKGIFSLAKNTLNETGSDGAPRIDYALYGTGDGMRTRACSGGFQPAGARTHDGRLWFPTEAGLSVLNPKELSSNMTPLAVNLERVSIDRKWTLPTDKLTLQPGEHSLTFEYSAPSFAFGDHPLYRYSMSGLEDGWSAPTMEQSARYTNVPPGEYSFRVAASRDGRHWLSEAQPLEVVLPPHYYATVQFYMGCCSLTLGVFYALHLRRVRKMRKALRLKATLVEKIIEAPKASADMALIQLNASLEEARPQLLPAPQPAKPSEHLDNVSFVLPLFVRELAEIAGRQAHARGLTLILSAFPKAVQSVVGDPRKLRLIVLNLLENAVELTPRGSIYLRVGASIASQSESHIHFSVTDTGMGLLPSEFKRAFQASDEPEKIAPEQFEEGAHRLYVAIRTARLLGGEIWVESKLGVGNTFHFRAPLSASVPSRSMLLEATAI